MAEWIEIGWAYDDEGDISVFETKDSGERAEFTSGMVRDTNAGKPRYDLMIPKGSQRHGSDEVEFLVLLGMPTAGAQRNALSVFLEWYHDVAPAAALFELLVSHDGPLLQRYAELMARGAEKYDARNWEQANGPEELARFRESAFRHFIQWLSGATDEDHAAAVVFNVRAADWLSEKLTLEQAEDPSQEQRKYFMAGGWLLSCECDHFPDCYTDDDQPCNKNQYGHVVDRHGWVLFL